MQKRNPALVAVLTIVTLGIYAIFWLHWTRKEINAQSGQHKIPPVWWMFAPLVLLMAAFAGFAVVNFIAVQNQAAEVSAKNTSAESGNTSSKVAQNNTNSCPDDLPKSFQSSEVQCAKPNSMSAKDRKAAAELFGKPNPVLQIANIIIFIVGIVATIGFIVVPIIWHLRYARALRTASGGTASVGMIFGIFLVIFLFFFYLYFAWIALAQSKLNRLADAGSPNQPQTPPQY